MCNFQAKNEELITQTQLIHIIDLDVARHLIRKLKGGKSFLAGQFLLSILDRNIAVRRMQFLLESLSFAKT